MNSKNRSNEIPIEFSAYFDLPIEAKTNALRKGVIVFDTSTLLSLYRIEPKQRKVILAELVSRINGRVWLPHQVFLEFSRHVRDEKLKDAQRLAKTQNAIQQKIQDLKNEIEIQKLNELDPDFNMEDLLEKVDSLQTIISDSIERVRKAYPDLSKSDEVLSSILKITDNRIFQSFTSQDEIDEAVKLGEARYSKEIPPGYLDHKKEGSYSHRGLQIPRKYGDWFIWHQLLKEIKKSPEIFKEIIFVTQDQKSDWWSNNIEKSGETIGPRFELRQEIECAGNKVYWQYTFQNFYKHLLSIDQEITPDQSAQLQEISNAEKRTQIDMDSRIEKTEEWLEIKPSAKSPNWNKAYSTHFEYFHDIKLASKAAFNAINIIQSWLNNINRHNKVIESGAYPDFLIFNKIETLKISDQRLLGVEIFHPINPQHMLQIFKANLTNQSMHFQHHDVKFKKIFFLIVLNEYVLHKSTYEEWNEALIDIQGLLISNPQAGVSIGHLTKEKFESLDEIFTLERPHLQDTLKII